MLVQHEEYDTEIPLQAHFGREKPEPEKINPIQNAGQYVSTRKPVGGLWTSTLLDTGHGYTTQWVRHRQRTNWKLGKEEYLYRLIPKQNTTLYVVENTRDAKELADNYSRNDMVGSGTAQIDFEQFNRETEYDGIRVVDPIRSWDVESTVWFDWCFQTVERIPQDQYSFDIEQ